MARRIIRTSITELLSMSRWSMYPRNEYAVDTPNVDIASPVVSAPMAFGTSGQLAAIVTLAGGFGFAAAGKT